MIQTEVKAKNWYTVKVQNNREKSVSERLKSDMKREYGEDVVFLIPTQLTIDIKEGKKVQKEKVLYPGYVFVQTNSIDKVAHLVKSTNGATNILRDNKGVAIILKQSEVDRMIGEKESNKNVIETQFIVGETVEIVTGPFAKFKGSVDWIDVDKNKVKVEVLIFGRSTLVDLTIGDILKSNG